MLTKTLYKNLLVFQNCNSEQNVSVLPSGKLFTVDDLLRIFPVRNKLWNTRNHPAP